MSRMTRENKDEKWRVLWIELKDHLDRVKEIRKELRRLLKKERQET